MKYRAPAHRGLRFPSTAGKHVQSFKVGDKVMGFDGVFGSDEGFPLEKIAEALEYVATGDKMGNVIITLDS